MLDRVLPFGSSSGASGNTTRKDSSGKLLELVDQDVEDSSRIPLGVPQEVARSSSSVHSGPPSAEAIASVITQAPPPSKPISISKDSSGKLLPLRRESERNSANEIGEYPKGYVPAEGNYETNEETQHLGEESSLQEEDSGPNVNQNVIANVNNKEHSNGMERTVNWRSKFRNILCCLAPDNGQESVGSSTASPRQADEGPVVLRPPPELELPFWPHPVIGPQKSIDGGKKTLVLDLDETLVHSSFRPVHAPDYVIPVEIEGRIVDVYVMKRPFVDHFLRVAGERFEIVVFTASLGKYADPLLDLLDSSGVVRWRLFREACVPYDGSYVKDLQCLGRDLRNIIIVDNSPHSYAFQPENAIPIGTFIDEMEDSELLECLEILMEVESVEDVRIGLGNSFARRNEEFSKMLSGADFPTR